MKSKFMGIQIVIYISFLILDITSHYHLASNLLKLSAIGLCLIWLSINHLSVKKRGESEPIINNYKWMLIILCFTFASDIFLLFTSKYTIGLATFIIVQLLYASRIRDVKMTKGLILGLMSFLTAILLYQVSRQYLAPYSTDYLMILEVVVYALLFASNLLKYGKLRKVSIQNNWMFIGLCLYAICDIQVAIYNLPPSVMIPSKLTEVAAIGMWLFYLPGQVILTLSATKPSYFKR
ncbi:hypothetical protein [Fusibacter bizertensis]